MTRVVSCMNLKGGSSKSLTTIHASIEAVKRGQKVLIVDTDGPQHSCFKWAQVRNGADSDPATWNPRVVPVPAGKVPAVIEKARADGFDLVLIDTSPRIGPNSIDIAKLSDRVVIPVLPGPLDMAAVEETIDVMQENNVDSVLFLTCRPSSKVRAERARRVLTARAKGIPVAAASLGRRAAFEDAVWKGKAVSEYQPKGLAAQEMQALIREVL